MTIEHVKDLLLQLVIALSPFVFYHIYYQGRDENYSRVFILITSMVCLFASMTFPSTVQEGILFDARYVIMFFGLLFGGLSTGFILLVEFMMYRLYIGGTGLLPAIIILAITFPFSVYMSQLYRRRMGNVWTLVTAGLGFSAIPLVVLYLMHPVYVLNNLEFHILVIPVQNSFGIGLLISLFNKSVADKELQLRLIHNEKAEAIGQVAASMAHEVRNPLTTVLGFLKLIRDHRASPEKVERFIDISIEEIKRTEQILTDYLAISKPLSQHREQIDLVPQLAAVIELMTPYATMHNVVLNCGQLPPKPVWLTATATEMKQMLVNFTKNAIEACSERDRGKVTLSLQLTNKSVSLLIQDNGIGMTEEQVRRLGSIYYSTKTSGTGLGLTFSYQLIRSMDGSVQVHSVPEAGTSFTIWLPLARPLQVRRAKN
ncbi:two-component system sporulation sensor kinase B [Paenibacillus phyllosphaerae]|uniref:histidine kinase n=1 Tax=Paenibacillus phyllosphaerae TaxID=274593 RepID=A0A7W5B559_9BACL|nr:HAMP domain-containing sensor histidine kinase [Paenibacillus phyllosphaerae]MBB3114603.1 two-component system sporulation sensor kinase B [Paenibacillus phyllosphaerae]